MLQDKQVLQVQVRLEQLDLQVLLGLLDRQALLVCREFQVLRPVKAQLVPQDQQVLQGLQVQLGLVHLVR